MSKPSLLDRIRHFLSADPYPLGTKYEVRDWPTDAQQRAGVTILGGFQKGLDPQNHDVIEAKAAEFSNALLESNEEVRGIILTNASLAMNILTQHLRAEAKNGRDIEKVSKTREALEIIVARAKERVADIEQAQAVDHCAPTLG